VQQAEADPQHGAEAQQVYQRDQLEEKPRAGRKDSDPKAGEPAPAELAARTLQLEPAASDQPESLAGDVPVDKAQLADNRQHDRRADREREGPAARVI
jgi:hypothetical protein